MEKKTFIIGALFTGILVIFFQCILSGQSSDKMKTYEVDITGPDKNPVAEHLKLGGTNGRNESIKVNNYYFMVNDKPFIPLTGEFHFHVIPINIGKNQSGK